MAITFREIRQYLARNVRLSICFEDGHYHNYLMVADIPEHKYDRLYVYGIGMVDVEFSRDVYSNPQEQDGVMMSTKDDMLEPAIEIVLHEEPREIERSTDEELVFSDFKPYLQIGRHFLVVNREDWSYESYEYRDDIPEKYDNMYVYGIGMEDNPITEEWLKEWEYNTYLKKRMVIVLSDKSRGDIYGNTIRSNKVTIGGELKCNPIKWIPVEDGYPDSSRQVLVTYKYDDEYEVRIGEYWNLTPEAMKLYPEEFGFGKMQANVIAWAEIPWPYKPE